jgi:ESS family glutamate:Na+ symporter
MEMLVYHCIALGFIALSLRIPSRSGTDRANLTGPKSGAIIVGSYVIQAIVGLVITIGLAYTFMPGLFKAAGILLPMGYGQGPGQANNVGGTYETMGFLGGRSFGLSLAATGYLCACIVGVIVLNVLAARGKVKKVSQTEVSGSVMVDHFQDKGEIPIRNRSTAVHSGRARLSCVLCHIPCHWASLPLWSSICRALPKRSIRFCGV